MAWTPAETNTHQDHVIAHIIGATPLAYFIWDETAYLVLDIGFIWHVYLDLQMGLVPETLAISELGFDPERTAIDCGPIESVEVYEDDEERRLVLNCELRQLLIETSLRHRWTRIFTPQSH